MLSIQAQCARPHGTYCGVVDALIASWGSLAVALDMALIASWDLWALTQASVALLTIAWRLSMQIFALECVSACKHLSSASRRLAALAF